jgi:hypothetical protein
MLPLNDVIKHAHEAEHVNASNLWIFPAIGGGERDRTDDLLLAKQALSQLSYTPMRLGPVGFGARSAALRISGGPGRI